MRVGVLLASVVAPVAAVRRAEGWVQAAAAPLLAVVMWTLGLAWINAWLEAGPGVGPIGALGRYPGVLVEAATDRSFWLGVGMLLGLAVGSGAAAGVFLAPWPAEADERMSASVARAIRRAWLVLPYIVLLALAYQALETLGDRIVAADGRPYYQLVDMLPWYTTFQFRGVAMVAVAALAVIQLLRVQRANRRPPRCRWPAQCVGCGYDLLASESETCPECGMWAEESIRPGARAGAPWAQRWTWGRWSTWWRTLWMSLRHPALLGRSLRAFHDEDARSMLLGSYALHAMVVVLCLLFFDFVVAEEIFRWTARPTDALVNLLMAGIVFLSCVVATQTALAWLAAALLASARRNLLAPAFTASVYLLPLMLFAVAAFWLAFSLSNQAFNHEWLVRAGLIASKNAAQIPLLSSLAAFGLCLGLWLLVLLLAIVRPMRYANW